MGSILTQHFLWLIGEKGRERERERYDMGTVKMLVYCLTHLHANAFEKEDACTGCASFQHACGALLHLSRFKCAVCACAINCYRCYTLSHQSKSATARRSMYSMLKCEECLLSHHF